MREYDKNKKARRGAGLFDERECSIRLFAKLGDLVRQPRDFAARIVLVNDVALRGTHQSGLGVRQRLQRSGTIAGLDRFFDLTHGSAHLGAARLVDGGAAGNLARRFLGGSGVGHSLKYPLR
jgi:hypothetical protein